MPARNLYALIAVTAFSLVCYQTAVRSRYASTLAEAMSVIRTNYIEPIDDRELFEGAMEGMVAKLDQYSAFIPPQQYSRFEEDLGQEFGGVGIVVELSQEEGTITVMSPLVGTPAHRAGIQAGDSILEIDDTVVAEADDLQEAVDQMRGPPGSEVRLVVRHAGEQQTHEIVLAREVIPIVSVLGDTRHSDGSWDFHIAEAPQIGYVRLTTFGDRTVEELREVLQQEGEQFDALILDLRDNAGGYLNAAVEVCDLFIEAGEIVSTRGRDNVPREEYHAEPGGTVFPRKPMVVLVNRYSASAAEIVAACLQDHGRAVVVGTRSWGKGTVQNVVKLEGGESALKLTTASYWRPSGQNIHRLRGVGEQGDWGVRPNQGLEVELSEDQKDRLDRWRRERDYPQARVEAPSKIEEGEHEAPVGEAASDEASAGAATPANEVAPVENSVPDEKPGPADPQRARAVEYLLERLGQTEVVVRE